MPEPIGRAGDGRGKRSGVAVSAAAPGATNDDGGLEEIPLMSASARMSRCGGTVMGTGATRNQKQFLLVKSRIVKARDIGRYLARKCPVDS